MPCEWCPENGDERECPMCRFDIEADERARQRANREAESSIAQSACDHAPWLGWGAWVGGALAFGVGVALLILSVLPKK